MADLLALADAETAALWRGPAPRLHGGTRATRSCAREIATLYDDDRAGRGARVQRRRGGDLRRGERPARSGRPRDRRLAGVPEPARGGARDRRGRDAPRAPGGGRLGDRPGRASAPRSRRARSSSSSTSRTTPRATSRTRPRTGRVAEIAADAGATLLSDEVYRFLEHDGRRPPAGRGGRRAARASASASCQVVRAGRAPDRLARDARRPRCWTAPPRFKDYTTICASAPAEILSLIALRARDRVLARSRAIVDANLAAARRLLRAAGRPGLAGCVPRGGPVGFPELRADRARRPLRAGPARGRGRPHRARPRSSATRATTSASASAAPTSRSRSPASRRSWSARSAGRADRCPSGSTSSTRPARTSPRR